MAAVLWRCVVWGVVVGTEVMIYSVIGVACGRGGVIGGASCINALFSGDSSGPDGVALTFAVTNITLGGNRSTSIVLVMSTIRLNIPRTLSGIGVNTPFRPTNRLLRTFVRGNNRMLIYDTYVGRNNMRRSTVSGHFAIVDNSSIIRLLVGTGKSVYATERSLFVACLC